MTRWKRSGCIAGSSPSCRDFPMRCGSRGSPILSRLSRDHASVTRHWRKVWLASICRSRRRKSASRRSGIPAWRQIRRTDGFAASSSPLAGCQVLRPCQGVCEPSRYSRDRNDRGKRSVKNRSAEWSILVWDGAPDRIRTCDLCLRRAALYPAELRVPERFYMRACGGLQSATARKIHFPRDAFSAMPERPSRRSSSSITSAQLTPQARRVTWR